MLSEKLDFLMKITNISNSTLGKYLSFDPSYISRIRSGKRGLPKHQPFIEPVADFFSRNLKEDYQKTLIKKVICPYTPLPDDNTKLKELIVEWLKNDDDKHILNMESHETILEHNQNINIDEKERFFYGNKGKRQAVVKFIEDVCALNKPVNLMFYTDEDMNWFCEDEAFSDYWTKLLIKIVSLGGKIKIIHSLGRGINDMLEILKTWLPIYLSGNVEPYYYPKLRDGIFHRTLFIAQGYSALISTSVGAKTNDALNVLLEDELAVKAIENEFANYVSMCRPLMNVYNAHNREILMSKLKLAQDMSGNFIILGTMPSLYTMPASLVNKMSKRTNAHRFIEIYDKHSTWFKNNLEKGNEVTEIINLPDIRKDKPVDKYLPVCDIFKLTGIYYEADEFIEHLNGIVQLTEKYPNYRVVIADHIMNDMNLLALDEYGIILARANTPATIFEITEQHIRMTFAEYLMRIADNNENVHDRTKAIKDYIEDYKNIIASISIK